MIEDLLAFSAVGSGWGEPEDVDLDDVLTQVLGAPATPGLPSGLPPIQ